MPYIKLGRIRGWASYLLPYLAQFSIGLDFGMIANSVLLMYKDIFLPHKVDFEQQLQIERIILLALFIPASFSSVMGGILIDAQGRKLSLQLGSLFLAIGSIVHSQSQSVTSFLVGRGLLGLGAGVVSVASPIYLLEMSPKHKQQKSMQQLYLVFFIGLLSSQLLSYLVYNKNGSWRIMIGFPLLTNIPQLIVSLIIQESPYYIALGGNMEQATGVVRSLHGEQEALVQIDEINQFGIYNKQSKQHNLEAAQAKKTLGDINSKQNNFCQFIKLELKNLYQVLPNLLLGCTLFLVQQASGLGFFVFNLPTFLEIVGFEKEISLIQMQMFANSMLVIGTVIGPYLLNKPLTFGLRKKINNRLDQDEFKRTDKLSIVKQSMGLVLLLLLSLSLAIFINDRAGHVRLYIPTIGNSTCPTQALNCAQCIQQGCSFCSSKGPSPYEGICLNDDLSQNTCKQMKSLELHSKVCPKPYKYLIYAIVTALYFCLSLGISQIAQILNVELYPTKVVGFGNGCAHAFNVLSVLVSTQAFMQWSSYIGLAKTFLIFNSVLLIILLIISQISLIHKNSYGEPPQIITRKKLDYLMSLVKLKRSNV